jgi:hypothetical protein
MIVPGVLGGCGLSSPPPPCNNRMVPTTAAVMMIAARIIHLLFPPGDTSVEDGFVGLGAEAEGSVESLDTAGNAAGVVASGNSGRTEVSTMGFSLSFEVCTCSWAFCAITGERLRASVTIHAITAYSLGLPDFML